MAIDVLKCSIMSRKNIRHYKFMQLEKRLRCASNVLESNYVDFYAYYLILSHKQFTLLVWYLYWGFYKKKKKKKGKISMFSPYIYSSYNLRSKKTLFWYIVLNAMYLPNENTNEYRCKKNIYILSWKYINLVLFNISLTVLKLNDVYKLIACFKESM